MDNQTPVVTLRWMPPTKHLRWGILGSGWMFHKFAEVFTLTRGAILVAVASREADRARAAAAKWNIPRAHGGYETLLADPDVDIVINALYTGLHCDWTIRALEAGKHVLCEKPLACSAREVERMFAAAHRHKRWLLEGFMFRFHPQIALVKRRVDAGDIGKILHIRSSRTSRGREPGNPRYWRDAGGGALLDIGCYCVNLSRLFAGEPQRVYARANFDEKTGVDLTLNAVLEFAGGPTANFVCSLEGEPSYAAEIVGTEGKLLLPHPWAPPMWPVEFVLTRGEKNEIVRVTDENAPQHPLAPFALEVEHFSECVRENRPPTFPPNSDAELDSRNNMRVIDALFASACSGNPVEVNR